MLISAVTAPGADRLPWDERRCAHLGPHKHDGRLGCRVEERSANPFNRDASDAWRRLHRRAYQETVREYGRGSVLLLVRVWELQARGVLHAHPVVGYRTPRQMVGARAYLKRLAELAPHYGFGFVHSKQALVKAMPAENAAAYLSSYFVKGKRGKTALWESVQSRAMPRSIIHVSVKLTQQTGCTMRNLRLRRAVFVVWAVRLELLEVRAVGALLEAFPGSELVPERSGDRGPPLVADVG